jgi:hypothetical protein
MSALTSRVAVFLNAQSLQRRRQQHPRLTQPTLLRMWAPHTVTPTRVAIMFLLHKKMHKTQYPRSATITTCSLLATRSVLPKDMMRRVSKIFKHSLRLLSDCLLISPIPILGYTLTASASWAADQSGCGSERDFPFDSNSDECLEGWATDFFCGIEDTQQTTSYGGGYVLKPPGNRGCLLIELYAHSTADRADTRLLIESHVAPVYINITTSGAFNISQWRNGTTSVWKASNGTAEVHRARLFDAAAVARVLVNSTGDNLSSVTN